MLFFSAKAIFKVRQIDKPYSYLVKAGFSPHAAAKITGAETRTLRLDHIERLCEVLHCEPNDLLVYKPNSQNRLPESHPLKRLIAKEDNLEWQETLKTMSLTQLREISKIITNNTRAENEL